MTGWPDWKPTPPRCRLVAALRNILAIKDMPMRDDDVDWRTGYNAAVDLVRRKIDDALGTEP